MAFSRKVHRCKVTCESHRSRSNSSVIHLQIYFQNLAKNIKISDLVFAKYLICEPTRFPRKLHLLGSIRFRFIENTKISSQIQGSLISYLIRSEKWLLSAKSESTSTYAIYFSSIFKVHIMLAGESWFSTTNIECVCAFGLAHM